MSTTEYNESKQPDDNLLLEPTIVMTAAERAFLADEKLVATLARVNANPEKRRTRERAMGHDG